MQHPDISKRKAGFPVPKMAEDVISYIKDRRAKGVLSHEVHTELLLPISNKKHYTVFMIWAEPNMGFTGHYHLRMWLEFNKLFHQHDIDSDHLPSSQFRETLEMMTCAATVRVLEHHLLGVPDGLDWTDSVKDAQRHWI